MPPGQAGQYRPAQSRSPTVSVFPLTKRRVMLISHSEKGKGDSGIGRQRDQQGVPPRCLRHPPGPNTLRFLRLLLFHCFCAGIPSLHHARRAEAMRRRVHHSRIIQSSTNLVYIMIPAPHLCPVLRVLSLFAANPLKCLSVKYLRQETTFSGQALSNLVKPLFPIPMLITPSLQSSTTPLYIQYSANQTHPTQPAAVRERKIFLLRRDGNPRLQQINAFSKTNSQSYP